MDFAALNQDQKRLATASLDASVFLAGPAGSGKTTVGVQRFMYLLDRGVPAEQILVLLPQRTLASPYFEVIQRADMPPGGQTDVLTLNGLAQRMINLFWPLISSQSGFAHPDQPPVFLTLETAQYYMAQVVYPLLLRGYFENVRIDRNRLFSQILDNLNKAALVGFDAATIADRLKSAWVGKDQQLQTYDQAQDCANQFRAFCLANNLLDFSLQVELFTKCLWTSPICRQYLGARYRHLIYDNLEEDVPVAHDIVSEWLPSFDSALLIYDEDAGQRAFLGADPVSALRFRTLCKEVVQTSGSWVTPPVLQEIEHLLVSQITRQPAQPASPEAVRKLTVTYGHFYPDVVNEACRRIASLVRSGRYQPSEIAVLSPYLSDSMRFSIMNQLNRLDIPSRSQRPSRSLRSEPATRCLLTLARLAHPVWNLHPDSQDVRDSLFLAIDDLDLSRATLLANQVYQRNQPGQLKPFDLIPDVYKDRISYRLGEQYRILLEWINTYRDEECQEFDLFLSRLFGEVLSQSGFRFHRDMEAAQVTARLIESVQKFRRVLATSNKNDAAATGKEYIQMVEEGLLAAQYLFDWEADRQNAVLISPAHTFLMANRPVKVQFWLDTGNLGWWQRLYQPLTQPHVLSRQWIPGRRWTDADEFQTNQQNLAHLVQGLLRRCQSEVFFYAVGINESGSEERGPLLQALQGLLRTIARREMDHA